MKISTNLGMILLAIWLIATGLLPLLHISVPATLLAILAVAAGVLILLGPIQGRNLRSVQLTRNLGMLLLGIWLILVGLLPLLSLHIPAEETILAILAVAAGILILLGR